MGCSVSTQQTRARRESTLPPAQTGPGVTRGSGTADPLSGPPPCYRCPTGNDVTSATVVLDGPGTEAEADARNALAPQAQAPGKLPRPKSGISNGPLFRAPPHLALPTAPCCNAGGSPAKSSLKSDGDSDTTEPAAAQLPAQPLVDTETKTTEGGSPSPPLALGQTPPLGRSWEQCPVTPDGVAGTLSRTCSTRTTCTVRKGQDDEGNKTINEYAVLAQLGAGSYGKVKLVTHVDTDQLFAIKIMNKSVLSKVTKCGPGKTAMDDVLREIAIMKRLEHPNVVRLHEVIDDPECHKLYLIMDYLELGPIHSMGAPPLPMHTLRSHLCGICRGIDYLHQVGIVHRDIKPENLLLGQDGVVRVTDFGVSHHTGDGADSVDDSEGTPAFLTPEQIRREPIPGRMTDLWALGVTIFLMGCGWLPFPAKTLGELRKCVEHRDPAWHNGADPVMRDLVDGLLRKDLPRRLGRERGVAAVLAHPFLAGEVGEREEHRPIDPTPQEVRGAVLTGRNITLRLTGAVGAAMKVQQAREGFMSSMSLRSMSRQPSTMSRASARQAPACASPSRRQGAVSPPPAAFGGALGVRGVSLRRSFKRGDAIASPRGRAHHAAADQIVFESTHRELDEVPSPGRGFSPVPGVSPPCGIARLRPSPHPVPRAPSSQDLG